MTMYAITIRTYIAYQCCGSKMFYPGPEIFFHPGSGILSEKKGTKLNLFFSWNFQFTIARFNSLKTVDIRTIEERILTKIDG
jgi:hypothetical protein